MERVQFQQEQMLPELKDLVEKGIFTQSEIKQIMRKRTAFETALVRRVAKKADFLRYAAYEMNLEALRKKRIQRLNISKGMKSLSDYSLVRRQFQIFERALRKFKGDVGLWLQYIQIAKREGARSLVGRISARALQLHPNTPALYILSASHELKQHSPAAARTLLQRGIRLNSDSVELWREYVAMELGFVESLRRRWKVLGIVDENKDGPTSDMKKGKAKASGTSVEEMQLDPNEDVDMNGVSSDLPDESEEARKEIMNGALIRAVIDGAIKALPKVSLFQSLHQLLMTYPCPQKLRRSLLDHLHDRLESSPPIRIDPLAAKLHATRFLTSDLKGVELVDALKQANEDLIAAVKLSLPEKSAKQKPVADMLGKVYVSFVEEWVNKEIDVNLKLYLITSVQGLTSLSPSLPSVLTAHIDLLCHPTHPAPPSSSKILKLARKYTSKALQSPELWLARLRLESKNEGGDWRKAWDEARKFVVVGDGVSYSEQAELVWTWGLQKMDESDAESRKVYEKLLRETMLGSNMKSVHERLLIRFVDYLHRQRLMKYPDPIQFLNQSEKDVKKILKDYLPTATVWDSIFKSFAKLLGPPAPFSSSGDDIQKPTYRLLLHIYENWRSLSIDSHRDAAIAFGTWLMRHGKEMAKEVPTVIERARGASSSSPEELAAFEKRWRAVLDEEEEEDADEDDEVEEEGSVPGEDLSKRVTDTVDVAMSDDIHADIDIEPSSTVVDVAAES